MPIVTFSIYMGPPGHYLAIQNGHVQVLAGPKEQSPYRPSVYQLYQLAVGANSVLVIGIALRRSLDDGTNGLISIHAKGSLTKVQNPNEAAFSALPQSVLQRALVDC